MIINVSLMVYLITTSIWVTNFCANTINKHQSLNFSGRTANDIFNAHSKLLANALTPAYEALAEFGIKNLMEGLTNKIPYDQLFPRRGTLP